MTATCYVTFGQPYSHAEHPVDVRAHPDGWFEYVGDSWVEASAAARRHLAVGDGHGAMVAMFAFDYEEQPSRDWYPLGVLARFEVVDGHAEEVTA